MTGDATSNRAATSGSRPVGPSPEFVQLLRGEITAREYVDGVQRQYGYDGEETLNGLRGVAIHARWWFLRGALIGAVAGFIIGTVLHV